jgi:serine/threonine protein kinase
MLEFTKKSRLDRAERSRIDALIKQIQSAEGGRCKRDVTYLGGGGQADVFHAYDAGLKRKVFIKIPKTGNVAKIANEGLRAARLGEHEHIVQVHFVLECDNGKCGLVMEFIEGQNLRECLPRLNGNVKMAVEFAVHICKALKQAHEHSVSIVHCDVKPENILISSEDGALIAKLTDFGIALEANMQIIERAGSVPYMAPEQIRQLQTATDVNPDVRWDLWAVAVILYEMLEGTRPFESVETRNLIQQIRNEPYPELKHPEVPNSLKRIVYRGLEKTPEERYQTASEMLDELEVFQYVYNEVNRVTEKIERDFSNQPRAYLKLSEMYTDESIQVLNDLPSNHPDPNTTLRLALLHGAVNEYDEAEAAIQETQGLELENPSHPLKQTYPFIKRFAGPEADEPLPKEEAHSDEDEADSEPTPQKPEPIDIEPPEDTNPPEPEPKPIDPVPHGDSKSDDTEPEQRGDDSQPPPDDTDYAAQIDPVKDLIQNEGKVSDAKEAADGLLKSCTNPEIYLHVGELFSDAGAFDYAIEVYESGVERCGDCTELYLHLGETLEALGYNRRTRETFKKAIEQGNNDPRLKERLQDLDNSS